MNRLFIEELVSVGGVDKGDNPDAEVLFWKRQDPVTVHVTADPRDPYETAREVRRELIRMGKRQFSQEQRERLADRGMALPDGSFPIANVSDLRNAIQAFGRASNQAAAKRHIIRRARALGATELLPDTWKVAKVHTKPADRGRLTEEPSMADLDLSGLPDDTREAVEDTIAKLTLERDEALAQLAPEPDPVADAPDEVREMLAKQADELAKAREALAVEKAARRDSEFIAKSKNYIDYFGTTADEIGPVLRKLDDAAPEESAKLAAWLDTAHERVSMAKLFEEKGGNESHSDKDAWVSEQLEKRERPDDMPVAAFRATLRHEWEKNFGGDA